MHVCIATNNLFCSLSKSFNQVNVPALQKIMLEFARENERSELTGELIGDTLDDALADDGDAEAEDQIVSQVGSEAHCMRVPGSRLKLKCVAETCNRGQRILVRMHSHKRYARMMFSLNVTARRHRKQLYFVPITPDNASSIPRVTVVIKTRGTEVRAMCKTCCNELTA